MTLRNNGNEIGLFISLNLIGCMYRSWDVREGKEVLCYREDGQQKECVCHGH